MKELKDKFYKNCLFLVQNFKDASERDIEQQRWKWILDKGNKRRK